MRLLDMDDPRVVHLLCNLDEKYKPMPEYDRKTDSFKELNSVIEELEKLTIEPFDVTVCPKAGTTREEIEDYLEPIKIYSALKSEVNVYEFRAKIKPEQISPLDLTVIYALKETLERRNGGNHEK